MQNLQEYYCSTEFSDNNPEFKQEISLLKQSIVSGNRREIKRILFLLSKQKNNMVQEIKLNDLNSLNFIPRKMLLDNQGNLLVIR